MKKVLIYAGNSAEADYIAACHGLVIGADAEFISRVELGLRGVTGADVIVWFYGTWERRNSAEQYLLFRICTGRGIGKVHLT